THKWINRTGNRRSIRIDPLLQILRFRQAGSSCLARWRFGFRHFQFLPGFGLNDAHGHEVRMRALPGKRCFSRFEKSIDDDGVTLRSGSSRHARGLTTDNGRSAINRDASCVREQYTTAEWNSFRVDGAMVRAQTRT